MSHPPIVHSAAAPLRAALGLGWLWLTCSIGLAQQEPVEAAPSTLTHPAAVRALSAEQAAAQWPVALTARVAFIASPGTVFVQDELAGTFFRTQQPIDHLAIGDLVKIIGVTFPGLYLTGIDATSLEVLAHGDPPPATPASFDDLSSGRYHYQRVALRGVVRRLETPEENRSVLTLALGQQLLAVRIDASPPEGSSWVDALIEVQGLAAGGINDRRQLVQPYLRVASWAHIQVLTPAAALDQVPAVSATRLLRFPSASGEHQHQHRVQVQGQVLASFPDGRLFLRDPQSEPPTALAARLSSPDLPLAEGQTVTLIGFPHMGGFSARLEDASLLLTEDGPAPAAVPTSLRALASADLDADLVRLRATLIEHSRSDDGIALRLQDGEGTLTALLPLPAEDLPVAGSVLEVTGICQVQASGENGFRARPTAIRLLLRSSADLRLLSAPAWWTPQRLITLVGVLVGLVVAGLIWISLLHRQVAIQGNALRSQISREAALEERQRIAREFHDTLEQELAGLSIRLGALGSRDLDAKASKLLHTSQQLVSRVQTEARNLVADLRSDDSQPGDLRSALIELVERQPAQAPPLRLEIATALPSLPAHIVHHLRMIAQEALTNILKHAQASQIDLRVTATAEVLSLRIKDDGKGFNPAELTPRAGHFGCIGIRERCRKMGATVEWQSSPNRGTCVTVQFPLNASSR